MLGVLIVEALHEQTGVEIRTVYAGVAGSHIRSQASDGVAAIAGGEVTRADVELLVLDEPTSGLDPLMEAVFSQCIAELRAAGFVAAGALTDVEPDVARCLAEPVPVLTELAARLLPPLLDQPPSSPRT